MTALSEVEMVAKIERFGFDRPERDWSMDDVETLIEIRGVYDGWSAARLKDGRLVNRWDATAYPARFKATEGFLAVQS